MSRRNAKDPLLERFLEDYKLNLLKIPRQDAAVGDAYADRDGVITGPGRLASLLVPKLTMPRVKTGEKLTNLSTTLKTSSPSSARPASRRKSKPPMPARAPERCGLDC
jgi:hypothetical protein